jgi:hypothetical protein
MEMLPVFILNPLFPGQANPALLRPASVSGHSVHSRTLFKPLYFYKMWLYAWKTAVFESGMLLGITDPENR